MLDSVYTQVCGDIKIHLGWLYIAHNWQTHKWLTWSSYMPTKEVFMLQGTNKAGKSVVDKSDLPLECNSGSLYLLISVSARAGMFLKQTGIPQ